jgi:CheY-like chemotaxis protein
MKEVTADFLRAEINRLGAIVVETGLFHPSGVKLHTAGDGLGLAESRALHEANFAKLYLLEFGEDERVARRSLGIEHVLPKNVSVGDQLAEDIRTPAGDLLLAAGSAIDESKLQHLQSASTILAVPIRHRKLAAMTKQAEDYLAKKAAAAPQAPKESGSTRIMRMTHTNQTPVRYLLIPRARVLVGIADDLLRTMLVNGLTSEGHEAVERKSAGAAVEDVFTERPHVILMDLAESVPAIQRLRSMEGVRNVAVVVCAEDPKSGVLTNALHAGANDWIPRPPGRDILNDKIKGCQDLLLRRVQVAPSLRDERRQAARPAGKGQCDLKDPALGKPLPIFTGDVVDVTESGIRIAYNLPKWPCPWAYTVHGVHPRHPFHPYATSNMMPRELRVSFTSSRGMTVEKAARVVHVSPQLNNTEVMGLTFQLGGEMKIHRSTTVRKF